MLPALLLVLATGLTGSPAAADGPSCPGGQACLLVTVTGSIQEQVVLTGDDFDRWGLDIQQPPYRTHSPGSTQDEPRPDAATSIPTILRNLPTAVPASSVTFVSTKPSADDTHTTRLGPGDLSAPNSPATGFQGNTVPGFWADTDRQLVRFARPMRSDDDLNYQDVWTTRTGGTATLAIHTTGSIVHPQIRTSTPTTIAGTPVGFTASFSDDPPPSGPTYDWSFGDGTTATGPTPKHTYTKSGTYSVSLETGAADGSEGTATPVRVQVGPKPTPTPAAPTKTPGTGTGKKHHSATGPTTSNGTVTNGTSTPQSDLFGSNGTTSAPSGTTGLEGLPANGPTSQTTVPTLPGTGDLSLPEGTPVSGILLVADATASSPTATKAAPVSAASARAVPRLEWDRGLLWLLLLPGLLVVGGLTQTRWWTRRLPVLPWRTP